MALPPTELETPCREWQGPKHRDGYGMLWREGTHRLVHRWVWTLMYGPIPKGIRVLHRCDNPPCFRLDHLFLGTQKDNEADKIAKGRHHNQRKTHCKHGHEFTPENTRMKGGTRVCIACYRRVQREAYYRRIQQTKGDA